MSEYKPTEYVVDFGDCRSNQFVRLSMALIEQNGAKLHEHIVRCRDCCFSLAHGNGCGRNQGIYDVEPDGFCAWGERADNFTTCKCGEDIETKGRESVTCPSCGRVVTE